MSRRLPAILLLSLAHGCGLGASSSPDAEPPATPTASAEEAQTDARPPTDDEAAPDEQAATDENAPTDDKADGDEPEPGSGPQIRPTADDFGDPDVPPGEEAMPDDDAMPFQLVAVEDDWSAWLGRSDGVWWGHAVTEIPASADDIVKVLVTPEHYGSVFVRFTTFRSVGPSIFYGVLALPQPLGDRALVVHRTLTTEGDVKIVRYEPEPTVAPPDGSATLLPGYETEWRLTEKADGGTVVQVTFQAEVGIPLPTAFAQVAVETRVGEELTELRAAATNCASCHAPK